MNTSQTYHNLLRKIRQLRPQERITRLRTAAWFMSGIFQGRSVHLSQVANKIPGAVQRQSKEQRLRRWLKNRKVQVRTWYEPVARSLLAAAAKHGTIRLLADGTKVGSKHRLLMVAIAYRRRALPIVWTWVRDQRGLSSSYKQCALVDYVHRLLPESTEVVLVGDSEFSGIPLKNLLESLQWGYVLRHKGDHLVRLSPHEEWRRFDSLVRKAGDRFWAMDVAMTQKYVHACHVLAYWRRGEPRPWLLTTNLPNPAHVYQLYSRRMWIEELFGDLKKHGFDLETTRLHHIVRLSRLTLIVALLYVWLVAFGSQAVKRGWRKQVDRADRRDLSIFRIGADMFERCLLMGQRVTLGSLPYF